MKASLLPQSFVWYHTGHPVTQMYKLVKKDDHELVRLSKVALGQVLHMLKRAERQERGERS